MIIDLARFIREEKPFWTELEKMLNQLETPGFIMTLDQIKRFHYLYQRASADLGKISTFCSEQKIRQYLESLVGTAYSEIHETREKPGAIEPLKWFFKTFPQTFRYYINAWLVCVGIFLGGCCFGSVVICFEPSSKDILLPFHHLTGDPSERVAKEEQSGADHLKGTKASFSSWLMTHNIKVSIFSMALGMTWGIGTVMLIFINGTMLGAVSADYILAGHTKFLAGWLLPHGAVEIPAFLLASQTGLILASAMIGWGTTSVPFTARLRLISKDLVTLIFGVSILLIWAGIVEAFFSQYHEPIIPYELKILVGLVELVVLVLFFWKSGMKRLS